MKIFAVVIVQRDTQPEGRILCAEHDLSTFNFFQRSTAQQFMDFTSKMLAERTPQAGQRQSLEQQDYQFHVYSKTSQLSVVLIADKEYTQRVAYSFLNKVADDFQGRYPPSQWDKTDVITKEYAPLLRQLMEKYQNPQEADNLSKIQKELDETKIIMHKTIEATLRRGENLDDLVSRSEALNTSSKAFYKTARQTNSCCRLM